MTTAIDTSTIDFKGLSTYEVQDAINTYVRQQAVQRAIWQERSRKYEKQQATRERVAKRAKVCNAIKRAGVGVATKDSGYRTTYAKVSDTPNAEGFYTLNFSTREFDQKSVLYQKQLIQHSTELEVKVEIRESQYTGNPYEQWLIKLA